MHLQTAHSGEVQQCLILKLCGASSRWTNIAEPVFFARSFCLLERNRIFGPPEETERISAAEPLCCTATPSSAEVRTNSTPHMNPTPQPCIPLPFSETGTEHTAHNAVSFRKHVRRSAPTDKRSSSSSTSWSLLKPWFPGAPLAPDGSLYNRQVCRLWIPGLTESETTQSPCTPPRPTVSLHTRVHETPICA